MDEIKSEEFVEQQQQESGKTELGKLQPNSVHCWLKRIMYKKRCDFDPLWLSVIVGGLNNDLKSYLGYIDLQGIL